MKNRTNMDARTNSDCSLATFHFSVSMEASFRKTAVAVYLGPMPPVAE